MEDCRFAHGVEELRKLSSVPGRLDILGVKGNDQLIQVCSVDENTRPRLNLSDALTVPAEQVDMEKNTEDHAKRRLDLFPCLDFTDEIPYDNEEDDSLLSCISREVLHLKLTDEESLDRQCGFMNTEGDHSPWNLPG